MKIIVCDDEPLARERLSRLVQEEGHEVLAQAKTGLEAIELTKEHQPDVILLDIRMPEMDGIRCAELINELDNPPAIVFVTAYDHYAVSAFKANAIGYLLKPANKDEIISVLAKATQLNAAQLSEIQRAESDDSNTQTRQHIAARTHRGVELIPLEDIYYFTADQKYVKLRHKNGVVLIDETLKELETEFEGNLFRIHRNALINIDYMEMLEAVNAGQYQVRFKDIDDALAVSRRHLPSLRDRLKNL